MEGNTFHVFDRLKAARPPRSFLRNGGLEIFRQLQKHALVRLDYLRRARSGSLLPHAINYLDVKENTAASKYISRLTA